MTSPRKPGDFVGAPRRGLIDTHTHLQLPDFAADWEEVLARAWAAGVEAIIVVGTDLETSRQAQEVAQQEPRLYAAVGIHPHEARGFREEALGALRELARSPRVVAIGEIGLDFYHTFSPRQDQLRAFREQLALARELRLPVIVHSRHAQEETYAILAEWAAQAGGEGPLGVMHCFGGELELALRYSEMGLFISIPCTVTYPNNRRLARLASGLPLAHMVVETDCPYLPPQSHRGRRNEPALLREAVARIAELQGLEEGEVAARTTANARRLFRLG